MVIQIPCSDMTGSMLSLAFLVDVMLLTTISLASPATGRYFECTCLPKQWEGNMTTWQRVFDVATGNWVVSQNLWTVHYDHQLLHLAAMVSTTSDTKIVYDSLRVSGPVYNLRGLFDMITLRAVHFNTSMRKLTQEHALTLFILFCN